MRASGPLRRPTLHTRRRRAAQQGKTPDDGAPPPLHMVHHQLRRTARRRQGAISMASESPLSTGFGSPVVGLGKSSSSETSSWLVVYRAQAGGSKRRTVPRQRCQTCLRVRRASGLGAAMAPLTPMPTLHRAVGRRKSLGSSALVANGAPPAPKTYYPEHLRAASISTSLSRGCVAISAAHSYASRASSRRPSFSSRSARAAGNRW